MRQLVTVAALMTLATAHAATTYSVGDVLYVNLREFAAENGMTYRSDANGIVLKSGDKTVKLFPYSTVGTLNGAKFTMAGPVRLEDAAPAAPLLNIRRAFGMSTTLMTLPPTQTKVTTATGNGTTTTVTETPVPYRLSISAAPATFGDLFTTSMAISSPVASTPSLNTVFSICKAHVESRLKAPATAQYSGESLRVYPGSMWTVLGTVDSQNAYGALVRGGYTCFARWANGQFQSVVDVTTYR